MNLTNRLLLITQNSLWNNFGAVSNKYKLRQLWKSQPIKKRENELLATIFPEFNQTTPGCAIQVVRDGKTLFQQCIGFANVEKQMEITPQTAFRLASLTKPFTAMAIMLLKEKTKLSFDQKLPEFFPDFPEYGKNITIRQLLTHTSGMPDHESPLYDQIKPGDEPTLIDSLAVLKKQEKTIFLPGSQYAYSDAGFVILALIIERVSNMKYAMFLQKNIFDPLDLKNTLVVDETKPYIKNRALGYLKTKNSFELFDYDPLNYIVGDEGIYSTTEDLMKWWNAWQSNILVSSEILKEAFAPKMVREDGEGCSAFSWFIQDTPRGKIVFNDGFWVGFNNMMLIDVETNTSVIILSNTTNTDVFSTEEKRLQVAKRILWSNVNP